MAKESLFFSKSKNRYKFIISIALLVGLSCQFIINKHHNRLWSAQVASNLLGMFEAMDNWTDQNDPSLAPLVSGIEETKEDAKVSNEQWAEKHKNLICVKRNYLGLVVPFLMVYTALWLVFNYKNETILKIEENFRKKFFKPKTEV